MSYQVYSINKDFDRLAYDKYLHYKHGFILCLFFSLYITNHNKILKIVSIIARTKEFIDGLGFGNKEQEDYLETMQGAKEALHFSEKIFNRG